MQIVSYVQDTFQECLPFKWGLSLFSFGCNLKCEVCLGYNYEKVTNKDNIIGNAIDLIDKLITPVHDCVVFIGGEPTIWGEELVLALKHCKNKGLKTKIFTNGMLPDTIDKINSLNLCDAWSLDYKCLRDADKVCNIENGLYVSNILKSIKVLVESEKPLEIRTTFYPGNERDRQEITYDMNWVISCCKKNGDRYCKFIDQSDHRRFLK